MADSWRRLLLGLLVVFSAVGCQRTPDPPGVAAPPAETVRADPAAEEEADDLRTGPEITLQLLDFAGIERLVASHHGQIVVMDAWSTSCVPCVKEFPHLVALQRRFGREKLACISLSFDYEGIGDPKEKAPKVLDFLVKQNAAFDNVLSEDDSDVLRGKFHLASIPAVFVYDKTGTLRKRFDNEQAQSEAEHFTYDDVERLVTELISE
jgi:thiol-disulfide isomerase/thioredoxin